MCEDFEYSGCRGNQNRFMDKQACEERCNANVIGVIVPITKYGKSSLFLVRLLDFVKPFYKLKLYPFNIKYSEGTLTEE